MTEIVRVTHRGRSVRISTNVAYSPINVLVTESGLHGGGPSNRLGLSMSVADATTLRNGLNLAIDKVQAEQKDAQYKPVVEEIRRAISPGILNNSGAIQRVREIILRLDLEGAL